MSLVLNSATAAKSSIHSSLFSLNTCYPGSTSYSPSRSITQNAALRNVSRNAIPESAQSSSFPTEKQATISSGEKRNLPGRGTFLRNDVGPNSKVLEAQGKVCTGPTQTKPLDEETAREVLLTILDSLIGNLPVEEQVSEAQMGAFFAAMTLRSTSFPAPTQWSPGEAAAMAEIYPEIRKHLPRTIQFLADPSGTLFDSPTPYEVQFPGSFHPSELRLVGALREVLFGQHLGFEETKSLLRDILPLNSSHGWQSDALVAGFLICQRMNRESDRELKAYCMAFQDDEAPVASVRSLTHYGNPYDGSNRFFRCTLFSAAVRASYNECCLLHGTEAMAPKFGVTEEQMLLHLGAAIDLSPAQAVRLLEDPDVGMAYLSLKDTQPQLYSLVDLRRHIKKRPTVATTEKVQRFIKAAGREAMVAGFYHEGYEDPLLMLMRRQGVQAGMVIKGEEGSSCLMTRPRSSGASIRGRAVNYCAGFRPIASATEPLLDGIRRENFAQEIDPTEFGFEPTPTPRTDRSVVKSVELGLAALRGDKGPAYDRIVFNAAMADHLLGCEGAADPVVALERARDAVDSGRALQTLENYIAKSWQK